MSVSCSHPHNPPSPYLRNLSLKAVGKFKPLSTGCLDSLLGICNTCCTFLHHNPVSVRVTVLHTQCHRLYCIRASGSKASSVKMSIFFLSVWHTGPFLLMKAPQLGENYCLCSQSLSSWGVDAFHSPSRIFQWQVVAPMWPIRAFYHLVTVISSQRNVLARPGLTLGLW